MPRIEVYFNLHKRVFSLRRRGKVFDHAPCVVIHEPRFVVQEAGRQRVLREKRKNVHAFVCGQPDDVATFPNWRPPSRYERPPFRWKPVRYNPYQRGTFVFTNVDTHAHDWDSYYPIEKAKWCALWVDSNNKPRMEAVL